MRWARVLFAALFSGACTFSHDTIDEAPRPPGAPCASPGQPTTAGRPPPPQRPGQLPSGFTLLASASELTIHDEWNGMGNTHVATLQLTRQGNTFSVSAKVAAFGTVGEPLFDPYVPRPEYEQMCYCAVAPPPCECEGARLVMKSGKVPAAPVDAYLREVARHAIDRHPPERGPAHTDDYPKGHVAVRVGDDIIHLSFLDQERRWLVDGQTLDDQQEPSAIHATYTAILEAIGLRACVEEVWTEMRKQMGGGR